jgi:endonuclease/exonuclease/phosphatase family metal-dependent hydrolase
MVTNVYGPTAYVEKMNFIEEIRQVGVMIDKPWIIVGDFNLIRSTNESTGQNHSLTHIFEFNHLINDLQLHEINTAQRTFTWSSKRRTSTLSKLDHIFLSQHWLDELGSRFIP